ncbi:hypothetical protein [Woodsholea maritima]|uniref:hypothetical protein n=1 Tax=Woodsholea maritima TaxID=240237 RepID=UPI0004765AE6|nr:hypothetical protein [Woodsholea maritima]
MALNESTNGWSKHPIAGVVTVIARAIGAAFALFLMAISIPLFFIPLPFGLPLFVISLIILAATSTRAHTFITTTLKRFPWVWNKLKGAFGE